MPAMYSAIALALFFWVGLPLPQSPRRRRLTSPGGRAPICHLATIGRDVGLVVDAAGRDAAAGPAVLPPSDSANGRAGSVGRQARGAASRARATIVEVSRVWSRWWNIGEALTGSGRVVRGSGGRRRAAEVDLDRVRVAAGEIGQRESDLAALDGDVAVEGDLRAVGRLAGAVGD